MSKRANRVVSSAVEGILSSLRRRLRTVAATSQSRRFAGHPPVRIDQLEPRTFVAGPLGPDGSALYFFTPLLGGSGITAQQDQSIEPSTRAESIPGEERPAIGSDDMSSQDEKEQSAGSASAREQTPVQQENEGSEGELTRELLQLDEQGLPIPTAESDTSITGGAGWVDAPALQLAISPLSSQPTGSQLLTDAQTADGGEPGAELFAADGSSLNAAPQTTMPVIESTSGMTSSSVDDPGPAMVKDINLGAGDSNPQSAVVMNGVMYFSAQDADGGYELWRSDGTTEGTMRVKDVCGGAGSSNPSFLTVMNGTLYFAATDANGDRELWKSDGTDAGTTLVKNIFGTGSSNPSYLTVVNNTLYFAATDADGTELWKSNGSASGTSQVKDIYLHASSSNPSYLAGMNGTLYFAATNGDGTELWKSDGTRNGTAQVKDIYGGTNSSNPASLTVVNGALYFAATDANGGRELWKSNGTTAGTVQVKDICTGTSSSNPSSLIGVSQTLYFAATDADGGTELWKSDGTTAGTVLVKDIYAGTDSSDPSSLANVNGVLYFAATDASGTELWKSNGTDAGTVLVKDIYAGAAGSSPSSLINVNGMVYFAAADAAGSELWRSDGTEAGTEQVMDIQAGAAGSAPIALCNIDGTLYFAANDGSNGNELWAERTPAIANPYLRDAVREALGLSPTEELTPERIATLTQLTVDVDKVRSLLGLQYASGLQSLRLNSSLPLQTRTIALDLSPIVGLTSLQTLAIENVGPTDFSAIGGMTWLQSLDVSYNQLTDISFVAGITSLRTLDLRYNQLTSLDAVSSLNLSVLQQYGNPITDTSAVSGKRLDSDLSPGMVDAAQNIAELAGALNYLPLQQYSWVLSNTSYQAYNGAMKSAEAAFQTRAGNDWDLNSLLASLFAADGITTHFVSGTISVPETTAVQWLGALNTDGAYSILLNADLEPTLTLVESVYYLNFNHTWLQAQFVGADGLQHWYDFDASWKFKEYQPGIQGLITAVPFDEADYLSEVRTDLAADYYSEKVADYLHINMPDKSLADVPYDGPIIPQVISSLPESAPFAVVGTPSVYAAIPNDKQWKLKILSQVPGQPYFPPIDRQFSLRSQTLNSLVIVPEEKSDHPGYIFSRLDINGVKGFGVVGYLRGTRVQISIDVIGPGNQVLYSNVYQRWIEDYHAIALDDWQISDKQLHRSQQMAADASIAMIDGQAGAQEGVVGSYLATVGNTYFYRHDEAQDLVNGLTMAAPKYNWVKTALVTSSPNPNNPQDPNPQLPPEPYPELPFYPELQYPFIPVRMIFDEKGGDYNAIPLDANWDTLAARYAINGADSSALEHGSWEEVSNIPSISSIKSLQVAAERNIPVYTINSGNSYLLNYLTLDYGLVSEFAQDIAAGYTIVVPQDYTPLNNWNGVGWIRRDSTGRADYRVAEIWVTGSPGAPAGMQIADGGAPTGDPDLSKLQQQPPGNPDKNQKKKGDPINVANGNLTYDHTDLLLPAIGQPLEFSRHYDSQVTDDLGMGPGWTHTYGDHLTFEPDDSVTWHDSEGHRYTFAPDGLGGYANPPTLFGVFAQITGGYTYRERDGVTYSFDTAAKLTRIEDRHGNGVAVTYNGSELQRATDLTASGRWIDFTYTSGRLTAVTDFTGRSWSYGYAGDALASVTTPTDVQTPAQTTQYDYYTDVALGGLLHQITYADGGVRTYAYYANRRAMSVTDELGVTQFASWDSYRMQSDFCDGRGNDEINLYNIDGSVKKTIHPDRSVESWTWENGLMTSWTDSSGNTEQYHYDALGNLDHLVDRAGVATDYTYEPDFNQIATITQTGNRVTTYGYENGNNTSVEDPMGNLTTMTYDSHGLLLTRTDPNGNLTPLEGDYTITYTYNDAGQVLTRSTDLPSSQSYTYDTRGNMLTSTDADEHQTGYQYDLLGRLIQTTDALPLQNVTTFHYDLMGNLVSTTDALNHTTLNTYDLRELLVRTTNPDGSIKSWFYDGNGNLERSVDELGYATNYRRDSLGRVTQSLFADGTMTTDLYDGGGRLIRSLDAEGNPATFTYDADGRLLSTTDALGETTTRIYDAVGELIRTIQPDGLVIKNQYDLAGRLTKTFYTDGGDPDPSSVAGDVVLLQTENVHDGNGNVIETIGKQRFDDDLVSETGELGDVSTGPKARVSYQDFYYDVVNRQIATVDVGTNGGAAWTRPADVPARSDTVLVTSYAYTPAGYLSLLTDPRGIATQYSYDELGRKTQVIEAYTDGVPTDSTNRTTEYTYDALGRVLTMTSVLPVGQPNQVTQYSYDMNGRLTATRYPDPVTGLPSAEYEETYTYNVRGDTTSKTDRNGTVHSYEYDALGRLTDDIAAILGAGVDGAVRHLSCSYTNLGQGEYYTSYADATGTTIVNQVKREYNSIGQLVTEYQSNTGTVTVDSPKVQYAYDATHGGRLTSMTYPNGRMLNYNYATGTDDTISRLSSISDAGGTLEQYTYLGLDTVVERAHPQPGVDLSYIKQVGEADGEAGDQYTGLDRFGRIADQRWTNSSGTDVDRYQYGYDRDGNVLWKENLLSASASEVYTYDSLNRLTSFQRGTLNANKDGIEGTPSRTQSWSLDALGNSNSVTSDGVQVNRTHNAQNELTQMGASTLAFDANGNTTTDQSGKTFIYDAWNHLVEVKDGETSLQRYAFDATGRRVQEGDSDIYFSAAGQRIEVRVGGNVTEQATWSPVYVNAMIERDRDTDSDGTLDERIWPTQDANWNVTGLVDNSGQVLLHFVSDPYGGNRLTLDDNWQPTANAYVFLQAFQGGFVDPVSGKIHFGFRDYDTNTMRWLEQDPAGYVDGGNLYQMERSGPVRWLDPAGLTAIVIDSPLGWLERPDFASLAKTANASGVFPVGNVQYFTGSDASVARMTDQLSWLGPTDIMFFHGHGIEVDGGPVSALGNADKNIILSAADITKALKSNTKGGPGLVVLSGCRSNEIADNFLNGGADVVVSMNEDVDNLKAAKVSREFLEQIIAGKAIGDAFANTFGQDPDLRRIARLRGTRPGYQGLKYGKNGFH